MVTSYNTIVKLLSATPKAQENVEFAGRLCYDTQNKTGQSEDWLQKRVLDGHESLIEHSSATFYIRCSRVVTHELVRHRLASYSQRSQRYVKEAEPKFITPPEIGDSELLLIFNSIMDQCWFAYGEMLKQGIKPEIARYVLPNACETQIIMTMNFRELRHFIKLRTSPRALPEMREVAGKVKVLCQAFWPKIFGDL